MIISNIVLIFFFTKKTINRLVKDNNEASNNYNVHEVYIAIKDIVCPWKGLINDLISKYAVHYMYWTVTIQTRNILITLEGHIVQNIGRFCAERLPFWFRSNSLMYFVFTAGYSCIAL